MLDPWLAAHEAGRAPREARTNAARAKPLTLLALVSLALLGARLYAVGVVGFGDSEALYASWALHPQPAYLDHPALVAVLARALGEGGAPTPARAHLVTALLATAVPWLAVLAARAAGAATRQAAAGGLVSAVAPITAVGLFGMTPDLLLAPLWLGALALMLFGLRAAEEALPGSAPPPSPSAPPRGPVRHREGPRPAPRGRSGHLAPRLRATRARDRVRSRRARGGALALALGRAPRRPPADRTALRVGTPSRLADAAAPARRHPGRRRVRPTERPRARRRTARVPLARRRRARVSGLLGPREAKAGGRRLAPALRDRRRARGGARPALPLEPCGRAALAGARVACGARPRARRGADLPRAAARLLRPALGVAAAATAAAHVYVLAPASARLAPAGTDMRLDIASELTGWPEVLDEVRAALAWTATPYDPTGREVVVVGPHWTIFLRTAPRGPLRRSRRLRDGGA